MGAQSAGQASPTDIQSLLRDPRLLSVLLLASAAPMSVAVVSPALPVMASTLGISDARIGLIITAITLPPMVLAPVIGVASDLYGRRTIAIPALFLFGAAGMAITTVENFNVILVLRGVQGVAMAGIAPVVITLLGDLYRGIIATTAQGLRASTTGLSLALFPLLAGWLAGFAWEFPFYLYGAAFVIMIVVYLYVPETSREIGKGQPLQQSLSVYYASVREELADPSLVIVMVGGFMRFFSLFVFITFVPIFAVRTLGASPFEAGIVVTASGIRIVASPTAGWWVARFSRKHALLGALGIIAGSLALIPFAPTVVWLGVLAAVNGIGDGLLSPVVNDTVTASVIADNRNGVVSALRVLKEAGKTIAPIALGIVLAIWGNRAVFVVTAVVVVVYAVAVILGMGSSSETMASEAGEDS